MLEFKPIRLEDAEWMRPLLEKAGAKSCEASFGNMFAWAPTYSSEIARVGDRIIMKISSHIGECPASFLYPVGTGDAKPAVEAILEYFNDCRCCFRMYGLEEQEKEALEAAFPGKFHLDAHREHSDYVYLVSDLIELAGKKYHQKRNHLKKFYELNWSFEPITEATVEECLAFNEKWCEEKRALGMDGVDEEQIAVERCLRNMEKIGCFGGILRVDGNLAAFTVAERLNDDTVVIHFEKADASVPGAYPAINREFLANMCREYTYVNREDDLGIEGLRKAKLSYHPVELVVKYGVTLA